MVKFNLVFLAYILKVKGIMSYWLINLKKYRNFTLGIIVIFCILITIVVNTSFRTKKVRNYKPELLVTEYLDKQPAVLNTEIIRGLDYLVVSKHQVKRGEDIWQIAKQYGTSVASIQNTNNLYSTFLQPGHTVLYVPNKPGLFHRANENDTIDKIVDKYKTNRAELIYRNNLSPFVKLIPGTILTIPNVIIKSTEYILPCTGKISSGYGYRLHPMYGEKQFHEGIDIGAPSRSFVRSSREGAVIFCGYKQGYGKTIVIKHPDGYLTGYSHLNVINVVNGQRVDKGEIIGRVGSSGQSTGPHLHFEIRKQIRRYTRPLNPIRFLNPIP